MSEQQEHRIEAALNVLREVRAPQGLEARMLEAVRQREAECSSFRLVARPVWVGGGVAIATVVMVALLMVFEVHHSGSESKVARERAAASGPSSPTVAKVAKAVPLPSKSSARLETKRAVRRLVQVQSEDSLAMREMLAASSPAPPMPLTEQERLLLRVVHKGDPMELAMLNPAIRAARDADEKAEVQRFFESTAGGSE